MPSLIWSSRALVDLARLHAFLRHKNPDAARRAIRAIRQSVRLLAVHPAIGRPVEGMEPQFRDWWIPFGTSGYVARYRAEGRQIVILAIRHAKEAGF